MAVREDGSSEMVVSASGQWLGIPELTDQMKSALLPREMMEKAFEVAGTK